MTAYNLDCPPLDACGPCGTLPAGFVRLRYFFGKRMGVADFVDEQRYHSGKMRFHNQRLHGAGLLCGLAVSMLDDTTTVLRVGKGAALDTCGREIVVGYDQCIDLAAWFLRELVERRKIDSTWPANAMTADGLPLVVAIRFRDCATSPEPAPRDTCSCDAAGCDLGRVREEFQLAILPANDPAIATTLPLVPPRASLDKLLAGVGAAQIAKNLAGAAAIACPEPDPEGWLVLASLLVEIDSDELTGVLDIDGSATLLAETALLQELLARQSAASAQAGALASGPEIVSLSLERDGTTTFYWLNLDLSAPVIKETVPSGAFTLAALQTSGTPGWTAIPATTDYVASTATTPARIRIRIDNATSALAKDGLYRLAIDPAKVAFATPIIDDNLRPLRPLQPSFHFGIDKPGADLVLAPAPYAR